MSWVFAPSPRPALPVVGTEEQFPVRRIFCVGRNYAAHAREMGHDPKREPPFFFSKPADALVGDGVDIPYPPATKNLHFEAELVVAIGQGGANIPSGTALEHVFGYAIGNDLTRRDLQAVAKEMGRPWDMAKGFDLSAPIGPVHPIKGGQHPISGRIALSVNGETRQEADLSDMIWSVPDVISFLSEMVRLQPGDLIMTGTPAGVGQLVPGDVCRVEIAGLGQLTNRIAPPG
ncbi:fumarylacetoacetate hydrolase family protein [Aliiroseovarius crassostreae]|uniref:fumarylacetoacetate hydrolase family protein n=1 Tax=Aliiroseovarius crassostreae TaxID=154981 RepID=UPI00220DFE89|nr:fumarylacetoacetate hydrolase family protein [Aliiroseovarius crassostreae]UWP88737.1 fumarylacetoacetate hydrolase family protein [Aliiroseovarius crassostreae]UWQ01389.1 fumarylacetoacetate hydrolase family protein [Aliiroseovarius crassostreae]